MGLGYQAVNVKAPELRAKDAQGQVSVNSSPIFYTMDVTHKATEVPEDLWGRYVTGYVVGGDCYYFFADSAAEVDRTVAATDNGARSLKLGGIAGAAQRFQERIPSPPQGGKLYFCREGSATGSVLFWPSSD